jgi:uncharacterized protein YjiS (DUF1127 family)
MNESNRVAALPGLFSVLAGRAVPAPDFRALGPAYRAPAGAGIGVRLRALGQAFELRRERARTRRALAHLDDRLLRDIGLTRRDVGVVLRAPFQGLGEALNGERAGVIVGPWLL